MTKKKADPVKKKTVKKGITKKSSALKELPRTKKTSTKKVVSVKKTSAKKTVTKKKIVVKTTKSSEKKVVKLPAKAIKDKVQLLADAAVDGILELKGKNITIMNLKKLHNRVCDYYIICQADSNTQVNAIAASVEEIVKKKTGEKPYRSEGFQNAEWILVDYVTVVVHIFQSHIRDFYNLESLWADADITELAFD